MLECLQKDTNFLPMAPVFGYSREDFYYNMNCKEEDSILTEGNVNAEISGSIPH